MADRYIEENDLDLETEADSEVDHAAEDVKSVAEGIEADELFNFKPILPF
jgi:hypothetical protein